MPDPTDVQTMTDAALGRNQEWAWLTRLAEMNYVAYFNQSHGKSLISGAALPTWDQQSEEIQYAWRAGAMAVQDAVIGSITAGKLSTPPENPEDGDKERA